MILNIAAYLFVAIDDADALALRLRERAESAALRGSVLVAPEGLNLFLAGEEAPVRAFLAWLREDRRFASLHAKESWSEAVPFAKLKVKGKDEIIAFRREHASPLDAGQRAPAVQPATLQRWIAQGNRDDSGKRLVLLDTRNREEFGFGTFAGAMTLPIDNFTDLPDALAPHREGLRNATVVSFCTGGIRCEKAALWLRHDGMENLLQLDGGILGYFEAVGGGLRRPLLRVRRARRTGSALETVEGWHGDEGRGGMSWIGFAVLIVAIYAAIKVVGALFKIALWVAILGFAWWYFGPKIGIPFPF